MDCPTCGFVIDITPSEKRYKRRVDVKKYCTITTKDGFAYTAHTVDVSKMGFGIEIDSSVMFTPKEKVKVTIEEMGIQSDAVVVWVKEQSDSVVRAGLRL